VNHRRVIVGLFVVSLLVAGTAAYDVARSDRPAEVSVADDADAYLGIEPTDRTITNGSSGPVLEVTNRVGTGIDLTVDPTEETGVTFDGPDETTLGPDETSAIDAECEGGADGTLAADLTATGEDGSVTIETDERVTVDCEPSRSTA